MNKIKAIFVTIFIIAGFSAFAQTTSQTIKVAGNCGMCQKNIEGAAKKAGAKKASWDKKTHVLTVSFDAAKTSNEAIQKNVAATGYDTELYAGDETAYKALEECCQYDNKRAGK